MSDYQIVITNTSTSIANNNSPFKIILIDPLTNPDHNTQVQAFASNFIASGKEEVYKSNDLPTDGRCFMIYYQVKDNEYILNSGKFFSFGDNNTVHISMNPYAIQEVDCKIEVYNYLPENLNRKLIITNNGIPQHNLDFSINLRTQEDLSKFVFGPSDNIGLSKERIYDANSNPTYFSFGDKNTAHITLKVPNDGTNCTCKIEVYDYY